MGFLPPIVQKIIADGSQFITEQGRVVASMDATAKAAAAAAEREAQAARLAASQAKIAADQQVLAAETSAKAAQAAATKTVEAQTRAAAATGDAQAKAAASVELAAAREAEASNKAAVAAQRASEKQIAAQNASRVASEKTAAAQELAAVRTGNSMKMIESYAHKISAVSIATAAAVALGAVEMAAKYEKSTMLLVTAGGESMTALDGVRKGILQISTSTGTSAEQMSEGMYIMEKAGYRGAAGLAALKAAAQGAKDENVDLATMSQAVTDVLLDYGYKMDTAAHATDSSVRVTNMLVAASGAAKTTMTDFANSMAAVVPIASTAKISFDQVGGAIATMTQHGQTAQESSQNLANLIQSLVRPNNMASAAMAQMGISTTDLAQHLGERGLSGSLQLVSDAIMKHMGPDGMVLQQTMKDNANAAAAMHTVIAQMPPALAHAAQGLLDGSTTIKQYTKDTKNYGGSAGALGLQLAALYKANSGVNDQLKAGRPALETYNAAMRDVFGNVTAARAATMLLMNDSHEFTANIKAIGEAGKKTGQDISTWADMQSTLSVQMDQAKQMVANLGIEIGTKLLPVAKNMLTGFTDLFHGFEQGNPVLLAVAGVIGGALTISAVNFGIAMGKTVVKTVTGLIDMAVTAMSQSALFVKGMFANEVAVGQFSSKAERAGAKVKGMGGGMAAAGAAATGFVSVLMLVGANSEKAVTPVENVSKALANFADAGSAVGKIQMDGLFQNWNKTLGQTSSSITGMDGAIQKFTNRDVTATLNDWADNALNPLVSWMGIGKGEAGQLDDKFKQIGDTLGQMVGGGSIDTAAKSFDQLALKFTQNGKSAQDALNAMPGYTQALKDSSAASGVELSQQELLEYAMGKVPAKMLDAMDSTKKYTDAAGQVKPITPALQKSLDNAGVSADGLVQSVDKILPAMEAAGLATVSTRDATSAFNKAIDDANGAVASLVKGGTNMTGSLNATQSDFNLTTDAGRQLNAKYESVLKAGEALAKQAAGDGVNAQKDVTAALQGTYDNLVNSGHQMGITGTNADNLARSVMGIPPGVDIKTWMDQQARTESDKLKGSVDAIPKDVSVTVHLYGADQIAAAQRSVDALTHAAGNAMATANQFASGKAYVGGNGAPPPGGYTGGPVASIMGFTGGGMIPGTPPASPNVDNILAMVGGRALKVRSGEFITSETSTRMNLPWLKASNAGLNIGDAMSAQYAAGYAEGGTGGGGGTHITVHARTDASAAQIAKEVGYQLLLKG